MGPLLSLKDVALLYPATQGSPPRGPLCDCSPGSATPSPTSGSREPGTLSSSVARAGWPARPTRTAAPCAGVGAVAPRTPEEPQALNCFGQSDRARWVGPKQEGTKKEHTQAGREEEEETEKTSPPRKMAPGEGYSNGVTGTSSVNRGSSHGGLGVRRLTGSLQSREMDGKL